MLSLNGTEYVCTVIDLQKVYGLIHSVWCTINPCGMTYKGAVMHDWVHKKNSRPQTFTRKGCRLPFPTFYKPPSLFTNFFFSWKYARHSPRKILMSKEKLLFLRVVLIHFDTQAHPEMKYSWSVYYIRRTIYRKTFVKGLFRVCVEPLSTLTSYPLDLQISLKAARIKMWCWWWLFFSPRFAKDHSSLTCETFPPKQT